MRGHLRGLPRASDKFVNTEASALLRRRRVSRACYACALSAALNSVSIGYDIGVSAGVAPELQQDLQLSNAQVELFVGALNFIACFGVFLSPLFSDRYGRRAAFAATAAFNIVGLAVAVTSQGFAALMLGRVVVGAGVGLGLALDPLYIAEISPADQRGMLVSYSEVGINVGITLGFVSDFAFSGLPPSASWRAMLGVGMALPLVILGIAKWGIVESPRWLVAQGRSSDAIDVLTTLAGPQAQPADVALSLAAVEEEVRAHEWERRAVGWRFLLAPSAALRRMLLVGVGVAAAQQIVGIDGIQYFMLYLLEQSGVRDRGARFGILVGLGAFKLGCVFVSGMFLVDRWGRRPTLIASSLGCACALMLLATNFLINKESIPQYANAAPALSVVALALYFGAFSLGVGPTCWLVPAEV